MNESPSPATPPDGSPAIPPELPRLAWPFLVDRLRTAGLTIIETGNADWSVEPLAGSVLRTTLSAVDASGQMAERGVAPLFLLARPDWETQLADRAAAAAWREAFTLLGHDAGKPPAGREAIALRPRRTPLPQVIDRLASGGARAYVLSESGLWLEIEAGQVWLCQVASRT